MRNAFAIDNLRLAVVVPYIQSRTITLPSGRLAWTLVYAPRPARSAMLTWLQSTAGLILRANIFTHALILAFIYTFAQDNRGKKAHFVIVQIPVEYLPWAMLTLTLIMGGWPAALQEGTGVIAAHLHDFLTRIYPTFQGGRNWIQTPAAVKKAFGADKSRSSQKAYGTSFRPGQPVPQPSSRGWTSALGASWGGRGAGRRLGGD